jgi:hypothetical protein
MAVRTNADLTWYSKVPHTETYIRTQIRRVAWEDRRAAMSAKGFNMEADEVVVFVPMARGQFTFKAEDVIVRGLVEDEISPGFTITQLKAKYPGNVATVRDIGKMDLGSLNMRHWQLGAS